jgi:hypothetical protein
MIIHYAIVEGLYRPLHILEGQGSSYALIYMSLPNRQSVHDSLCLLHCGPPYAVLWRDNLHTFIRL